MRIILLLSLLSLTFAADSTVNPTRIDRIQGTVDATTGKIESLQIWDVNEAVDAVGRKTQIGERVTSITRADAPGIFNALDNLINKTTERDAAHKARPVRAAVDSKEK